MKKRIEYKTGNLLDANVEALVNAVNCVGIMGRGIALQFKKTFPANFEVYRQACDANQVQPGRIFVYETCFPRNPKFIINFPTKRHWRDKSRMEDIKIGLLDLKAFIQLREIKSIAVPALGCGLGGLNWNEVRDQIELVLGGLEGLSLEVFEPQK
jgi:O-acetyl-ADP-ribose deacetylase (regulator of RNase III)